MVRDQRLNKLLYVLKSYSSYNWNKNSKFSFSFFDERFSNSGVVLVLANSVAMAICSFPVPSRKYDLRHSGVNAI